MMRYALLLVGMLLFALAASYGWSWCAGGGAYPGSIGGSQRQLWVMIGGMVLLGCGLTAAGIGAWKQASLEGFLLGLVLGPLGVVAAFRPDNRPKCGQCGGRLHRTSRVCPNCHAAFGPRKREATPDPGGPDYRRTEGDLRHASWMAGQKGKSK